MFNLNEFRNRFKNGGARPSQFEMRISWPDLLRGAAGVAGAEQDFRFLCQVSSIPPSTVGDIQVPYFGKQAKYAGDRTFPELTLTVLNDEDFKVRTALELWSEAITGHQTSVSAFDGGNVAGGYATDGTVTQFSRNEGGSATKAYKFVGMFPTNIGEIELNWATQNEVERFPVIFQYQYWLPVDPNTGAPLGSASF